MTRTSGVTRFLPVAMAMFLIQLDFFALSLALPQIAVDLGSTTTNLQWVISGYMLALGSLLIPASRLGDLLGRKRILLVGVAVFGVASLLCGLAQSPGQLVVVRILQGVGAAMIMPNAFSLISNDTTDAERPRVLGLIVGLANIGTAAGPLVGGALVDAAGWRWVFWVNVPFAVIALIWGQRSLRESRPADGHRLRHLDWLGVILVASGVAFTSWGLDNLSTTGLLAAATGGCLALGLLLLVGFGVNESRQPWPLLSPDLMRRGSFVVLVAAGTVANIGYAMMILVVTVQLQQVRDLSPVVSGIVFTFPALATAFSGPLSGRLAGRVPDGLVMAVAICVGSIGLLIQAAGSALVVDVVGLMLSGLGFAMGYAFTNIAAQSVLPTELSGQASSVIITSLVTFGGIGVVVAALGIEVFGGGDLAVGTEDTLLATGVVGLLLGLAFGAQQVSRLRRAGTGGTST